MRRPKLPVGGYVTAATFDEWKDSMRNVSPSHHAPGIDFVGIIIWLESTGYYRSVRHFREQLEKLSGVRTQSQTYSNWKVRGYVPQKDPLKIAIYLLAAHHSLRCPVPENVQISLKALKWWHTNNGFVLVENSRRKFLAALEDASSGVSKLPEGIFRDIFNFILEGEPEEEASPLIPIQAGTLSLERIRDTFRQMIASGFQDISIPQYKARFGDSSLFISRHLCPWCHIAVNIPRPDERSEYACRSCSKDFIHRPGLGPIRIADV